MWICVYVCVCVYIYECVCVRACDKDVGCVTVRVEENLNLALKEPSSNSVLGYLLSANDLRKDMSPMSSFPLPQPQPQPHLAMG